MKGSEGNGWLRGLAVHDAKVAAVVGDNGQILRSDDGGNNWQPVAHKGHDDLLAAACNAGGVLAAVGQKGTLLLSHDAGKTWKQLDTGASDDLRVISAAGNSFYVVGGKGTVLRVVPDTNLSNHNP